MFSHPLTSESSSVLSVLCCIIHDTQYTLKMRETCCRKLDLSNAFSEVLETNTVALTCCFTLFKAISLYLIDSGIGKQEYKWQSVNVWLSHKKITKQKTWKRNKSVRVRVSDRASISWENKFFSLPAFQVNGTAKLASCTELCSSYTLSHHQDIVSDLQNELVSMFSQQRHLTSSPWGRFIF